MPELLAVPVVVPEATADLDTVDAPVAPDEPDRVDTPVAPEDPDKVDTPVAPDEREASNGRIPVEVPPAMSSLAALWVAPFIAPAAVAKPPKPE